MLSHFHDPLPLDYFSFKHTLNQLFPVIFDTKFLSEREPFKLMPVHLQQRRARRKAREQAEREREQEAKQKQTPVKPHSNSSASAPSTPVFKTPSTVNTPGSTPISTPQHQNTSSRSVPATPATGTPGGVGRNSSTPREAWRFSHTALGAIYDRLKSEVDGDDNQAEQAAQVSDPSAEEEKKDEKEEVEGAQARVTGIQVQLAEGFDTYGGEGEGSHLHNNP